MRMKRRKCLKTLAAAAIGFHLFPRAVFGGRGAVSASPAAVREFPTRLMNPKAIAVDCAGNVYVGCSGWLGGLQKFVPSGDGGQFTAAWAVEKHKIRGIALSPAGQVCATSYTKSEQVVKLFSADGALLKAVGSTGKEPGQFCGPTGIAANRAGELYVVESSTWPEGGGHRVQKFSANGKFLLTWGSEGTAPGQLNLPTGIALDGKDNIYVADSYNCRVQKFSPDGAFLATWGTYGDGDGQLNCAQGIAVGPDGNLYIADTYNNRIQQFTAEGKFIVAWGKQGTGAGEFWLPCGIAVDAAGTVYVADTMNNRVQMFAHAGNARS